MTVHLTNQHCKHDESYSSIVYRCSLYHPYDIQLIGVSFTTHSVFISISNTNHSHKPHHIHTIFTRLVPYKQFRQKLCPKCHFSVSQFLGLTAVSVHFLYLTTLFPFIHSLFSPSTSQLYRNAKYIIIYIMQHVTRISIVCLGKSFKHQKSCLWCVVHPIA